MALVGTDLARVLFNAQSQKTGGDGKPIAIPDQMNKYAKGIVNSLKAATLSNAPGTINGVTAVGAPLTLGQGVGGVMVISPNLLLIQTKDVKSPDYVKENNAIIAYIATGTVTFAPGQIIGQGTASPVSPGPLAAGAGSGGKIVGITGAGAVAAVSQATGIAGPGMLPWYSALINYILVNATAAYAVGSVQGVCPAAGGPLAAGTGIGGTIS